MTAARHILAAGAEEAAARGAQRMTLSGVAARAGVSRMTVYRHYASAAALLAAVLGDEIEALLDEAARNARRRRSGRARTVDTVAGLAELLPRSTLAPELGKALAASPAALGRVAAMVAIGVADGSVRRVDPRLAAGVLLSAALGVTAGAHGASAVELRRLLDGYLRR